MTHPLIDYLLELKPHEFEQFIADLWSRRGFETEVISESQDRGQDIIATQDHPYSRKVVIQTKRYAKGQTIGRPEVQQYAGVKQSSNDIDELLIITTSAFTSEAKDEAREANIKLIDGTQLSEIIEAERAYDLIEKYIEGPDTLEESEIEYTDQSEESHSTVDELESEMEKRGLVTSTGISSLDELRAELRETYGFEADGISNIEDALRYVYIGQESSTNIGVPYKEGDERFEQEIDILKQLNLVYEHHYSGKDDYGYDCTDRGSLVGSEIVSEYLQQHLRELERTISELGRELSGVFLKFGFSKTDEGHLSTRFGGGLSDAETMAHRSSIWDVVVPDYQEFKEKLVEIGVAADVGQQVILPPEFDQYSDEVVRFEAVSTLECYLALKELAKEEIGTRNELIRSLDYATEDEFKNLISEYSDNGLTTEYTEGDPPFIIRDKNAVLDNVNNELRTLLTNL